MSVRIDVLSLPLINYSCIPFVGFLSNIYIYLAIIPSILYFHLFCTFSTSTCRHIEMLLNVARTKGRKIETRWMLVIYIIVHFPGDTWLEAGSFLKSLKHRRRIVTSCPFPRATIFRARFRRNRNEPAIVSCGRGRSLWVNIREYEEPERLLARFPLLVIIDFETKPGVDVKGNSSSRRIKWEWVCEWFQTLSRSRYFKVTICLFKYESLYLCLILWW